MTWLWKAYVAALLALVALHLVLPGGVAADLVYTAIGMSSVLAILIGVAIHRPAVPLPWYLMALGQAAWVAGDVMYSVELASAEPIGFPAPSDIVYLASYPPIAAAVVLLIRAQRRSRDLAGLIDSTILTAGVGLLSWAFIAVPIIDEPGVSRLGTLVAVAYPAGDILILAMLVRLMTGQASWTPSFRLLVGAALAVLAADTGFAASPTSPEHVAVLDMLWLGSYVLWGAAALHPDMRSLAAPALRGSTPFTGRRLLMLSGAVLLPAVLLIVRETTRFEVALGTLVVGAAVLSLLAMGRMACDIEEIRLATRQRDRLHDDLFRRATQDEVTGLANRPSFVHLLELALDRGRRQGTATELIVIEVGGIGDVARQYGHHHGDAMLTHVAARIGEVVGPDDTVARIATHQFAVMIEAPGPDGDLVQVAHDLLAACRAPAEVKGKAVTVSACVGVVVSPDGSTEPETLMREAELAVASARADGKVEFFDSALRAEAMHREEIDAALVVALRTDQLEVHYQPLMTLPSGELGGYEALVRWRRPGHGLVPPDSFIPVAESSDLICDLDRWMLSEVTHRLAAWTRADPSRCAHLTVAVNISGRSLAGASIVDDVAAALRTSGLEPSRLTLEITETVVVDLTWAIAQMTSLRRLGVRISIDDFGTGYTSIGQLGQLPVDAIKIDRSLVTSEEDGAAEMLALIAKIGHARGLRVVAEGVEEPGQLAVVTELHYDVAQGFLIGRPVPTADVQHALDVRESVDRP